MEKKKPTKKMAQQLAQVLDSMNSRRSAKINEVVIGFKSDNKEVKKINDIISTQFNQKDLRVRAIQTSTSSNVRCTNWEWVYDRRKGWVLKCVG